MHIGPRDAEIAFITDFPGDDDVRNGKLLQDAAGQEFNRMLGAAGLQQAPQSSWGSPQWELSPYHIASVFTSQPAGKEVENFFATKKAASVRSDLPSFGKGRYLCVEYEPEVLAFQEHLSTLKPKIIVALGSAALWALVGQVGIRHLRGAAISSPWGQVLPTFAPRNILKVWGDRPIAIADFGKAARYARLGYTRPTRRILVSPTLHEAHDFTTNHIASCSVLSVDIETKNRQITCVGFAPRPDLAMVVPFWDSAAERQAANPLPVEKQLWRLVRKIMAMPMPKLFQNGAYDIQYFLSYGIPVVNASEDSMILQHSLYPELPKSLGFLGSIHTDEPAWKLMRRNKADTVKREDG